MKLNFAIAIATLCFSISTQGTNQDSQKGHLLIAIEQPDSLISEPAVVSISVTDGSLPYAPYPTIGSEILLNSELKGYIEDIGYYFENADAKTDSNLDLLMMTQGWRRYDSADIISDSIPDFKFPIEQTQSISGHVETLFNRHPKGMKVILFSPTTFEITQFQLGDSSRFVISGLDFMDKTPFTLEARTKNDNTGTAVIHIEEPTMPQISSLKESYHIEPEEQRFIELAKEHPMPTSLFNIQELGEVSVTIKKPAKWSNRGNLEPHRGYKNVDNRIGHFPSIESMLRSLSIKIRHTESTGGALPEPQFGEYVMNDFIPTPVFIDGFRSTQQEAFNLHPQNVSSIEYFRPGDARVASYAPEALYTGILIINTQYGSQGKMVPQLSMANITPLGYQSPVEFYSPKYPEADKTQHYRQLYRATLYWQPDLRLSQDNSAKIEFYIPAEVKNLNINVQGIMPDGKIIDVTKSISQQ